MKYLLGLLLSLTIATVFTGCQSPGIVQLSPDTYMITKEDHHGIFGAGASATLKAQTIREANAFAESQGKVAIPLFLKPHSVGVMGDWASWEYQFRVVDKADPEARRTGLIPHADFVIEKNENISADIRSKDETDKKPDLYTELTKLDDLRKKSLITDSEYEGEKQKLLNRTK